ncbi:hypothetical protein, conserved [Eimeria acervulina]|uniref:ADF-H domain-containing protein n=1 Tax=Eimeria acervulina TaxID=5801 RepID=U6GQW2_EIMAC|nr:hypothetical protein, conserved [Eimeria acervulina]CDI81648.1 hypothetical protein, conserved [Eimeria acervulina]
MQLAGGGSAAEAATTAAEEEKKDNSSFSGFTFEKQTQSLMDSVSQRTCKENIIQLAVDLDTCIISTKKTIPFDGCSRKERLRLLLTMAKENGGPSLFVFRVDFRSNSPEWALLAWVPEDSVSYAERMFFCTALSWLSGTFVDARSPVREYYITEEAELPCFKWT